MTTVLLVDDEAETLAAWEQCCICEGFDVRVACDGRVALSILSATQVDLVVADWRMPNMSGSALCQHIRNAPSLSDKIFILISAEISPPAFVEYDCYLRKPVDMPDVFQSMRRLLAVRDASSPRRR